MSATSIAGVNKLPYNQKREIYNRLIPNEVLDRFHLSPYLVDKDGNDLLELVAPAGSTSTEISLYHEHGFEDPILYGHMTDTMNGQIHLVHFLAGSPHGGHGCDLRLDDQPNFHDLSR